MDCIFCKLANGEIPTYTVYEDENFRVILDVAPASKGHCLILPKTHAENLFEMPDELLGKAHILSKKIATAVKKAVDAQGVNILQNSGAAAGQSVMHYHVHVVPRHTDDKIQLNKCGEGLSDEEFAQIRDSIVKQL